MKQNYVFLFCTVVILFYTTGCKEREKKEIPAQIRNVIAVQSGNYDFDTYSGFRDWDRIPLSYPFELSRIDGSVYFNLDKLSDFSGVTDFKGRYAVLSNLKSAAPMQSFLLFEHERHDYDFVKKTPVFFDHWYGIFWYESEIIEKYSTLDELYARLTTDYQITKDEVIFYSFNELFEYFTQISWARYEKRDEYKK